MIDEAPSEQDQGVGYENSINVCSIKHSLIPIPKKTNKKCFQPILPSTISPNVHSQIMLPMRRCVRAVGCCLSENRSRDVLAFG